MALNSSVCNLSSKACTKSSTSFCTYHFKAGTELTEETEAKTSYGLRAQLLIFTEETLVELKADGPAFQLYSNLRNHDLHAA